MHGFEKHLAAIVFGALAMSCYGSWRVIAPPEMGRLDGLQRFYRRSR